MGFLRKALRKLDPTKKGLMNPLGGVLQKAARKAGDPFSEKNTPAFLKRAEQKFGWASPGVSTRRELGTLSSGKGLFHRNLKSNLAKTREAHAIQEDQSGRTAARYKDIEARMKSGDPAVKAQAITDYNAESKRSHNLALSHGKTAVKAGLAASALVSGGEALAGGSSGSAAGGAGAAGAGEVGSGGAVATGIGEAAPIVGTELGASTAGTTAATTAADEAALAAQLDAVPTASQTGGLGSTLSQVGKYGKYAVPLIAGALKGTGATKGVPAQQQVSQISAQEQAVGNQLLADYQSGKLQPYQQAALDQYTTQSKSAMRQQLANAGISDSTMMKEEEAKIDQNAAIMYGQYMNNTLNQGLAALNPAISGFQGLANQQIQANTDLNNAWQNSAQVFMQLLAASGSSA